MFILFSHSFPRNITNCWLYVHVRIYDFRDENIQHLFHFWKNHSILTPLAYVTESYINCTFMLFMTWLHKYFLLSTRSFLTKYIWCWDLLLLTENYFHPSKVIIYENIVGSFVHLFFYPLSLRPNGNNMHRMNIITHWKKKI